MGAAFGKSTILLYDHHTADVQPSMNDMIVIEGDNLDACQLSLTLHPPRVIPLCFDEIARINQQNLTGEQSNSEVAICDFPGTKEPIRWPPLEAVIEFGTGGVSARVVVDYLNGVSLSVVASYLRVSAVVSQSKDCNDIFGTSAAYYLAAHVGPGYAEAHAQRTIFVGDVEDHDDSDVFDVPMFANVAILIGCRKHQHKSPTLTTGWIRFWQDPKGEHCVGDFFVSDHKSRIEVPNTAQYFSVFNESGHKMKMSVIFKLAL